MIEKTKAEVKNNFFMAYRENPIESISNVLFVDSKVLLF